MCVFTAVETTVRENLRGVCGQIHPALGFSVYLFFFKLLFQRIFMPGGVGAAGLSPHRGRGEGRRVQGAAPPAAAGAERLRAGVPTPRIPAPAPDRLQLRSPLGTGSVPPTREDWVCCPVVWGALRILGCDGKGGRQGSRGILLCEEGPGGRCFL